MLAVRWLRRNVNTLNHTIFRSHSRVSNNAINFEDHRTAFQGKPTSELMRALLILKLCSYDIFVNNSLKLMNTAQMILGPRLFEYCIRPTFYNQFIAGDDRYSLSFTIEKLKNANINPMIACMMEEDITASDEWQEENYCNNLNRIVSCTQLLSALSNNSCLQVKVTGLMSAKLTIKVSECITDYETQKSLALVFSNALITGKLKKTPLLKELSDKDLSSLEKALQRFAKIGANSLAENVKILIDAEFISMNPALNTIAIAMMAVYNNDKPLIWCTIQCYLKSALETITQLHTISDDFKVHFGAKIVRGAYMEQERQLAANNNYADPINDNYLATGEMYLRVVDFVLQRIKDSPKCTVVMATHNEQAIRTILDRIIDWQLDIKSSQINFAQLYGMCEQITMPLARAGVTVYKSIPYGTVSETLPYLYRRATENRSVVKGARKEREMLWMELKHRMTLIKT